MRRRQLTFGEDCVYCSFRRQFDAPALKSVQKLEDETSREIRKNSRRQKTVDKNKPEKPHFASAGFCFEGLNSQSRPEKFATQNVGVFKSGRCALPWWMCC